jgi:hypothetical protein
MELKTCPRCQRTYSDATFSFCLDDGSLLSASSENCLDEEPIEKETVVLTKSGIAVADAAVRKRTFKPRAHQEETGITDAPPVRGKRESDTYWYTRLLTHSLLGMHYRTPQFNMYLLEDMINSRAFGKNFIRHSIYIAPGNRNLRFTTNSGAVEIDAHQKIDPAQFVNKFGLSV